MIAAFFKHKDPNDKSLLTALAFAVLMSIGLAHGAHASILPETAQYSSSDVPAIKASNVGCFVSPTPQMAARGERFYKEGC